MANLLPGRNRRTRRARNKIRCVSDRPRLSIFRSNKYIYAQIIDDKKGETRVAVSEKDLSIKEKNSKIDRAKLLGKILSEKAAKLKINKVVFDKGPYKYHGRIKALAEGAREGGLEF